MFLESLLAVTITVIVVVIAINQNRFAVQLERPADLVATTVIIL